MTHFSAEALPGDVVSVVRCEGCGVRGALVSITIDEKVCWLCLECSVKLSMGLSRSIAEARQITEEVRDAKGGTKEDSEV